MDEADFNELANMLESQRGGFLFEDERLGFYAETLDDSVFTTPQTPPPDCLTCGACCVYFHQILISITDATPRSLAWEVLDSDMDATYWLRREASEARCVAFEGQVGANATCAIYELRPTACRAFEAGSDRCHALRRMYGLEPKLSAQESDRHRQLLKANQTADALDEELPDLPEDEAGQLNFLRELVAYHLDKFAAIIEELQRLIALFNASGAAESEAHGQQVLEITRQEMADLSEDFARLKATTPDDTANRFLIIGGESQLRLEGAINRLNEVGELAYKVLGMKAKLLKDAG